MLEIMGGGGSGFFASKKTAVEIISEIYAFYKELNPSITNHLRKNPQTPRSNTFWKMATKTYINLLREDELRMGKLAELRTIPEVNEMKRKLMQENSDLISKFEESEGMERTMMARDLKKRME